MNLKFLLFTLSVSLMGLFFFSGIKKQEPRKLIYLPLGDSYTICTGAKTEESWPVLLTKHLNENKIACTLANNPAKNGFTTQNLIDLELPICRKLKPDFVTVLIGVNDWVRGVLKEDFHRNLVFILDEVKKNMPANGKLLIITIPDFGVTPEGQNYGGGRDISAGIAQFNTIISNEAKKRSIPIVDIFELSKKMGADDELVADDDLHPSAKEYAIWEKVIFPTALKLFK
jgi:acyl-CoA thioesterase I